MGNWVKYKQSLSKGNTTFFSVPIIMDNTNLGLLAIRIGDGVSELDDLFKDPNSWINSVTFYPIDLFKIRREGEEINSKKFRAGNYDFNNEVKCNNIRYGVDTFFMGQIQVLPTFNNFMDFSGYRKIKLYLPYYGFVEVEPNEVNNRWIQVFLKIDFQTGYACYITTISNDAINVVDKELGITFIDDYDTPELTSKILRLLGTYEFQLGVNIGLGKSNSSEIKRNIVMGAIGTVANLVTYGLTRPATTIRTYTQGTRTITEQSRGSGVGQRLRTNYTRQEELNMPSSMTIYNNPNKKIEMAHECFQGGLSALGNLTLTGSSQVADSFLSTFSSNNVHIVYYTPKVIDTNYAHYFGLPLGEERALSDLRGFTTISMIHLEGNGFITVTEEEKGMIMEALSEGVIL